jgi:antitoxin VapB
MALIYMKNRSYYPDFHYLFDGLPRWPSLRVPCLGRPKLQTGHEPVKNGAGSWRETRRRGNRNDAHPDSSLRTQRGNPSKFAFMRLIVIIGNHQLGGTAMDTARIFQSGRSQAVRLPKEYRFEGDEVVVRHFGNGVLLLPLNEPWAMLDAALDAFEPGFQISRDQPDQQLREEIA